MRPQIASPAGDPAEGPRRVSEALSFPGIFEREASYVWNTVRRMGVAERDREDMVHEVFLLVHRESSKFDATRPVRPWLFGIAFRLVSDYRRLLRNRVQFQELDSDTLRSPQSPADDVLIAAEEQKLVEAALRHVDLDRRVVLMLHEIDGFTIPETARALGIPLSTAYSRLRLGRADFARIVQRMRARENAHG
ncbi:MAG TPA: RNA polymerase sigma factor [Polyangia bacterium]|nr:RNA polymerase sigma factor [Polyangia bacterium]